MRFVLILLAGALLAQMPKPGPSSGGAGGGSGPGGSVSRSITIPIAGDPIGTGTTNVGIPSTPVQFSCTVNKVTLAANAAGSLTVDVWKKAGAVPSASDKISASAPATLSSAQVNSNSAITGWTTAVSSGDVFWASVASADGILTTATVQIWCQ